MADGAVPDSWDQSDESSVESKFSGMKFNPNAPAFVPGQNINAPVFVPNFGGAPAAAAQPSPIVPLTESEPKAITTKESPAESESPAPDVADDWSGEAVAEIKSAGGTGDASPRDDRALSEEEEDDDEQVEATQVAKVKRKAQDLNAALKKEHVNIVFIGHVDAGKSTIGGRVLQTTGMVDQRTLEKYEKEAKEKNRETWYLSWALDTNIEERDKGKTVEVGRAYFETENRHFTILDAPGHNSFVPNMIGGAAQADVAVLVISARKGEFETGFERRGQTREHAMLVKTAGVKHLIILINKMDDPTVEWDEKRYNECRDKLIPYLKKVGFNPKTDLTFMPCSGLTGAFIKDAPPNAAKLCPWYSGPTFLSCLESLPPFKRVSEGPVRIPIVDRYKDMGTIALGKVESGQVQIGQRLIIMPNKTDVEIMSIWSDEIETEVANVGENVKLKLKNAEEKDIQSGFVLCSPESLCQTGSIFDAQVMILEHKSIICAGYSAILHLHCCSEEITIKALLALIDRKTGEKTPRPRFVKQDQSAIIRLQLLEGSICLETFKDFPQMGRFTLRDEGKTIAIGKVLKVVK